MKASPVLLALLAVVSCAPAPGQPAAPPEDSAPTGVVQSPTRADQSPTAESPSPSPSPSPSRVATINVSGDLLWHNSLWDSAALDAKATGAPKFDFAPQLAALGPYVSKADLGICHSEVPFAPPDGPYKNYPMFAAPQEIAPALAATGWDLCTTASRSTGRQGS